MADRSYIPTGKEVVGAGISTGFSFAALSAANKLAGTGITSRTRFFTALVIGATSGLGSDKAKAEPAKPAAAPKPSASPTVADNVSTALDIGLGTAATVQAARLTLSAAAWGAAGLLARTSVPIAAGMAAHGAYQGYQKNGVSGIALGAADGLTGGGVSTGLAYLNSGAEKKAAAAPAPVKAPAPQAAQGGSASGDGGMKSYTTADGRSVQGTAAQIASWEGRKK